MADSTPVRALLKQRTAYLAATRAFIQNDDHAEAEAACAKLHAVLTALAHPATQTAANLKTA